MGLQRLGNNFCPYGMHPDRHAVDEQSNKSAVIAFAIITTRYHTEEYDIVSPAERLEQQTPAQFHDGIQRDTRLSRQLA